jgi:hypothetical protein
MTGHLAPSTTFTDWLSAQLDAKLATLGSDQARYRHLILCYNAWTLKYARFRDFGSQPFNEPHPQFGDMDSWDFALLLADIDRRKKVLENSRVSA